MRKLNKITFEFDNWDVEEIDIPSNFDATILSCPARVKYDILSHPCQSTYSGTDEAINTVIIHPKWYNITHIKSAIESVIR